MSLDADSVIILDDDDDDNDVEVIETNNQVAEYEQKRPERRHPRTYLPLEVNGYVRPSIPYPKLITQALFTSPNKRATAQQICDTIANMNPYFKHCPDIWHKSIHFALNKRKKFFTGFGLNEKNERIWGMNISFEKIMIAKWVPKYMQNKYLPSLSINTNDPLSSTDNSTPVIVNSQSLRPQSPIFVSSGKSELVNYEELIPETNCEEEYETSSPFGEPEFALEDPEGQADQSQQTNLEKQGAPWEPIVTVSDKPSKYANKPGQDSGGSGTKVKKYRKETYGDKGPQRLNFEDFSLENMRFKQIKDDEINYRLDFQKEHPQLEKFRLHCTVCDRHLGTSSLNIKHNVRFHIRLGVLICTTCYLSTSRTPFKSCQWCCQIFNRAYNCSKCTYLFCEQCLIRNFGDQWCQRIFYNKITRNPHWTCFICDPKPIWPHRAIAYFLYRHHKEFKRQKSTLPRKYVSFSTDLSTCCKNSTSNVPSPFRSYVANTQTPGTSPAASATSSRFVANNQTQGTSPAASIASSRFFVNKQTPGISPVASATSSRFVLNSQTPGTFPVASAISSRFSVNNQTSGTSPVASNSSSRFSVNSQTTSTSPEVSDTSSRIIFNNQTSNTSSLLAPPTSQKFVVNSQIPDSSPVAPATSQRFVVNNQIPDTSTIASATSQRFAVKSQTPKTLSLAGGFVIDSQPPNQIYLTTPSTVSSLTLNTGTQYIHNVYPNKNYVVVQAPTQNDNTVSTSTLASTVTHAQTSTTMPMVNSSTNPLDNLQEMVNVNLNEPSYNKHNCQNTQESPITSSEPLASHSSITSVNEKSFHVSHIFLDENNAILPDDNCSVIPNEESREVILPVTKPADETQALTARQRIERRPMPKSKKQSLLRMVLMNESIESMKKHLMVSETEVSSDIAIATNKNYSEPPNQTNIISENVSEKNVEEPILKSIIETATERLFELKKKQNSISSSTSRQNSTISNNFQLDPDSKITTESSNIPKIKIRTLKELQYQNILDISEQQNPEMLAKKGEAQECNTELNTVVIVAAEVNVTPLKEGIIEACRTLVNTQRKLKELATVISSNLVYNTETSRDLVSTFKNILNSCQKEFNVIDKTVKKEYSNLFSHVNMDYLNESMQNASATASEEIRLSKKTRKVSKIHGKNKKPSSISGLPDQSSSFIMASGCQNVDKSNLLANQPLESMDSETNPFTNQQILKMKMVKARKKRCLWNDKRRKRDKFNHRTQPVMYNKDGSIIKRRGRPLRSRSSEKSDEDCNVYQTKRRSSDLHERLRKQNKKPILPLRLSERRHPSSEEYISHLISQYNSTAQLSSSIRPCSVLLHRLHPRIVELLKMRAAKVL